MTTTNQDIQLISEFLKQPDIYELFQIFLEQRYIEGTEAELIIQTLEHEDQ